MVKRRAVAAAALRASGIVVALIALSGTLAPATGQAIGEPCTEYLACALRLESRGFFSSRKIVRGASGEEVSGYGRSEALEALFQQNDSAAVWYASFEGSHRGARWLGVSSALLVAAGFITHWASDDRSNLSDLSGGLILGGIGVGFVSVFPARNAENAMSQAVWWYNSGLARRR